MKSVFALGFMMCVAVASYASSNEGGGGGNLVYGKPLDAYKVSGQLNPRVDKALDRLYSRSVELNSSPTENIFLQLKKAPVYLIPMGSQKEAVIVNGLSLYINPTMVERYSDDSLAMEILVSTYRPITSYEELNIIIRSYFPPSK